MPSSGSVGLQPQCLEVKSQLKSRGMLVSSNFLVVAFLKLAKNKLKFYNNFIVSKVLSFHYEGWGYRGVTQLGACLPNMQGALSSISSTS